jgi:4-oxalocrotonate tautomerase
MPMMIFEGPVMDVEKKRALVKALTDAASQITGIRREAFTITIHENPHENIGVGGELLPDRMKREGGKPGAPR